MKVYNLKAPNRGSAEYKDYEFLKNHYNQYKQHMKDADFYGIKVKILTNYLGYITAITEDAKIFQAWASEFEIK